MKYRITVTFELDEEPPSYVPDAWVTFFTNGAESIPDVHSVKVTVEPEVGPARG